MLHCGGEQEGIVSGKPRKIPIRLTGQQAVLSPESRSRFLSKPILSASPLMQELNALAHKSIQPAS